MYHVEVPVPPKPVVSVPERRGVMRSDEAPGTMVSAEVRPVVESVEVAKVMAAAVVVAQPEPSAVRPLLILEVATHMGTPLFQARMWPGVPVPKSVEVAIDCTAFELVVYKS